MTGDYHEGVPDTRRTPPEEPPIMPEFAYTDLLPLGPDDTEYRLVTADGVTSAQAFGRDSSRWSPGC